MQLVCFYIKHSFIRDELIVSTFVAMLGCV